MNEIIQHNQRLALENEFQWIVRRQFDFLLKDGNFTIIKLEARSSSDWSFTLDDGRCTLWFYRYQGDFDFQISVEGKKAFFPMSLINFLTNNVQDYAYGSLITPPDNKKHHSQTILSDEELLSCFSVPIRENWGLISRFLTPDGLEKRLLEYQKFEDSQVAKVKSVLDEHQTNQQRSIKYKIKSFFRKIRNVHL